MAREAGTAHHLLAHMMRIPPSVRSPSLRRAETARVEILRRGTLGWTETHRQQHSRPPYEGSPPRLPPSGTGSTHPTDASRLLGIEPCLPQRAPQIISIGVCSYGCRRRRHADADLGRHLLLSPLTDHQGGTRGMPKAPANAAHWRRPISSAPANLALPAPQQTRYPSWRRIVLLLSSRS